MSHYRRFFVGVLFASFLSLTLSVAAFASQNSPEKQPPRKIKVDVKAVEPIQDALGYVPVEKTDETAEFHLSNDQVDELARFLHENRGRCGGYKDVTDGELKIPLIPFSFTKQRRNLLLLDDGQMDRLVAKVSEERIRETIEQLSSLKTRRYNTESGKKASEWVVNYINEFSKGRDDVSVGFFEHQHAQRREWVMPSVIARLEGTENPEETVIIGGHLDSINMNPFNKNAPGADDDASGSAAALEVFRVLVESGIKPKNSVEYMAYSAEEVGLWGSQAIAKAYRQQGKKVKGVMQLDMVLYPSADEAVYLITDHVDPNMTKLVQVLAEKKLGLNIGLTRCGYACSDHASWNDAGYSSVFPFESASNEMNPHIHTANDTLENAPWTDHAVKFGKLGVAFMYELAYK